MTTTNANIKIARILETVTALLNLLTRIVELEQADVAPQNDDGDQTCGVNHWPVQSFSDPKKYYLVSQFYSPRKVHWSCSCPHWMTRLIETGDHCKHIDSVREGWEPAASSY